MEGYIMVTMDPRNIYIAIAPGTYTNFKVVAESMGDDDNEYTVTKTKSSVTFEKGKVYDLGTFGGRD